MLRVLLVISPRATSGHTLGSGMLLSCRESRSVGRAEACKHWNQCPPGASLNFRSREAGLQRQAAARRPAGRVARSLHTATGMLVARALPAGLGACSKVQMLFCDGPSYFENLRFLLLQERVHLRYVLMREILHLLEAFLLVVFRNGLAFEKALQFVVCVMPDLAHR